MSEVPLCCPSAARLEGAVWCGVVGLAPDTGERQRGRFRRVIHPLDGKNVLVNLDGQP